MVYLQSMKSANPTDLARRRYTLEFGGSMVAYAAVLIASLHILKASPAMPWRAVVAVTPVIPLAFVFAAILRFMLASDELQRQIQLESLALAAGATALLAVTYGFLEGVGFPHASAWYTYLVVMTVWAISVPFVKRRYK